MPEPTGADADTPLEPWFQALADDYHRPPPAPREAMWARIQAARAAGSTSDDDGDAAAAVVVVAETVSAAGRAAAGDDLARRRASRGGNAAGARGRDGRGLSVWAGPALGLAAAAVLLLVAGAGWWTRTPAAATAASAAAPATVAVAPELSDSAPADASQPSTVGLGGTVAVGGRPADPGAVAAGAGVATRAGATRRGATTPVRSSVASSANARVAADRGAATGEVVEQAGATADRNGAGATYRLAAAQYLGQAEALLTVFRAGATGDAADPSLRPWARELLTTTRLLLDSPAARDPRLGALLDELEPVLVQIVQLPAARAAEERQFIARSIERSDLMTQLRSAVPAGPAVPQRAGE
ncbi:MAG: hypothetical protein ACYC2G_11835 [Gemmatimonadaceae bacterium]